MWPVHSDVLFDWTFDSQSGQNLHKVSFGVVDSSGKVKFLDVNKFGTVFPMSRWPSSWTWYQNRLSWTGDVANNRVTFKLKNAALNDSREFYCRVEWAGVPLDSKEDVVKLVITGKILVYRKILNVQQI